MPYKTLEDKKEYQRVYRLNNREKLNKLARDWRIKNIDHVKEYDAEYAKMYRKRCPEKFRAWDKTQKIVQRDRFKKDLQGLRIECGGKCSRCGYCDDTRILQFHHLGDKDIEVSRCRTIARARTEAAKCILLCPNCHAIEHLNEH